eukprot:g2461.t1
MATSTWPSKWAIIYNPNSGRKLAKQMVMEELVPSLQKIPKLNDSYEIYETKYAGNGTEIACKKSKEGYGLIAVGGDGTILEIILGQRQAGNEKLPMGIIAGGSLNYFAICGSLPTPNELPGRIMDQKSCFYPTMEITFDNKDLKMESFEAIYVGRSAYIVSEIDRLRKDMPPPVALPKIVSELVENPSKASFQGIVEMELDDGTKLNLDGTNDYFWDIAIICRNPFTGAQGDDMWVSISKVSTMPSKERTLLRYKPPNEGYTGGWRCTDSQHCIKNIKIISKKNDKESNLVAISGEKHLFQNEIMIMKKDHMINIIGFNEKPKNVKKEYHRNDIPASENALKELKRFYGDDVNPNDYGAILSEGSSSL